MHPYDRGRIGPTIRSNPTWTLLGRCLSSINCENSKLGRTLLASHDPRRASAEAVELRISTSRPDNPRTPAPRQAAATSALRSGELSSPGTRTEGRVPAGVGLGCESLELTDVLWEASARPRTSRPASLFVQFEQRAAVLTAKEAWSPSDRPPYPHPTSTPHITSRLVYAPAYFERRHFARDDTAHAARAFSIDPDIAHPASEKASQLGLEYLHLVLAPSYLRQIISTSQLLVKGTVHHFARRRTASRLEIDRPPTWPACTIGGCRFDTYGR